MLPDKKVDSSFSFKDKIIFSIIFLIFSSFVVLNNYFGDTWVLYRLLIFCLFFIASCFLLSLSAKGKQFFKFLKDSQLELKKVIWPTKQEASNVTLIVLITVVIFSFLLWCLDSVIILATNFILGV